MAERANESILLYLIDMAISEVQSKMPTKSAKRDMSNTLTQFPKRYSAG